MTYNLVRVITLQNRWAELWFANPDCVWEKPHKLTLFDKHQLDMLYEPFANDYRGQILDNVMELDVNRVPDVFKTIDAEYVEVYVGLHKHVSLKQGNGLPVLTRYVYVFVPLVDVAGRKVRLQEPRQLALEQINRYWIPVDED